MIPDTSIMDSPVEQRSSRLPWILATAATLLIIGFVVVKPMVSRWASADRSVERDRLRFSTVSRGDLIHDIAVQGRIVAASRPTLYTPSTGIVSLMVREGERVTAGSELATIESPELRSRLEQERASTNAVRSDFSRLGLSVKQRNLANQQQVELLRVRAAAAGREVERSERLAGLGLLNEIELEKARDDLTIQNLALAQAERTAKLETEMLEFELEDAALRLDRQHLVVREIERQVTELTIRSPFDGLVATISVEDRDAVATGQALLGIVDLSDLEVEVNIPESYADDVSPGIEAVVTIDGTAHRGVLTRVAPEVRNSQVEGRVAFEDGTPEGLRQNQRVASRLVLDRRTSVLKVSRGPFLESLGQRQVYVVDDDLAKLTAIEVGAVSVTEVEIVSGLDDGDAVVLSDLSRFAGLDTLLLRD